MIVLVMLEIGSLAEADLSNRDQGLRYWNLLSRDADIAGFLYSRPGPIRADFNRDDIPYNFGDWYGVESYMGYVASAPQAFMRVQGERRTQELFGVRYYVGKQPSRFGGTEVFSSATGIKVYEMASSMPRAWAVHEAVSIRNLDELGPRINSVDLKQTTFLLGDPPPLESCHGDQVRLLRHDVQRVTIDASMNCRGMVILGDGYSQDWVATVDGKRAPVYAAYAMVRGVVADGGHHEIDLRYRPMSVYIGGFFTAASLAGVLLIWLWSRRLW
jgi:uncharacterized membrane protein YfhO